MLRPSLRTKSIGTKLSKEEYADLERAAQTEGKTLGEWCRGVMPSSANGRRPKATETGGRWPCAHGRTSAAQGNPP